MNPDPLKPIRIARRARWHNRGYLPHCDAGNELTQSVTFRIGDSVPSRVIAAWQVELKDRPERERLLELHRLIEAFLDTGWGAAIFAIRVSQRWSSVRYSSLTRAAMPCTRGS